MHGNDDDSGGFVAPTPCYFSSCPNLGTIPAIGTYNAIFGLEETLAMALCDRHAVILNDVVVLVTTE